MPFLVSLLLLLMGGLAAGAADSGDPDASSAPGDTMTWSVRPTPTEALPDRPNFSYELDPGGAIQDSIRVRNFGTEPLSLSIYAGDALTTSSGALDLQPAGVAPVAVGSWIVLETSVIEVPPQDFVDVGFTLVAPTNAESGDHTGGIVTSFRTPTANAQGQTVVVDRRLGSRVQVRISGDLAPSLEVSDIELGYSGSWNPLSTGTLSLTYTVTNTGNVRMAADQLVSVPGRLGFPGREAVLDPMPELLPGNSLTFTTEVPDVWATVRTRAVLTLTPIAIRDGDVFSEDSVVTVATSAWSVPWTLLVAVAVVVLVPLWRRWTTRRNERRQAAQVEQAVRTAVIVQEAVQAALAPRPGAEPTPPPSWAPDSRVPGAGPADGEYRLPSSGPPTTPVVIDARDRDPGVEDSDRLS